jgi:hypothetical protein
LPQSDGKIVAVGTSLKNAQNTGGQTGGIVVARYLAHWGLYILPVPTV